MKKVLNYTVEFVESQNNHVLAVRRSSFKSLEGARSYFRTCVNCYEGIQYGTGSFCIHLRLIKGSEKDEVVYIDVYHKYF